MEFSPSVRRCIIAACSENFISEVVSSVDALGFSMFIHKNCYFVVVTHGFYILFQQNSLIFPDFFAFFQTHLNNKHVFYNSLHLLLCVCINKMNISTS